MEDFEIKDGVLIKYHGNDAEVIIPKGVTSIGRGAFAVKFPQKSALKKVIIPEGVTHIGEFAFHQCRNLESVTLPSTLQTIENIAFRECEKLESIVLPEHLTSIGGGIFYGCTSLKDIYIPKSLTDIGGKNGYAMFTYCKCRLQADEENPAYACRDGVLYDKQFRTLICCPDGITEFVIPEGVTTIGKAAFMGCTALKHVTFPESLTSIENRAFFDCKHLTDVKFPEQLKCIDFYAFSICTSLTEIVIPSSVNRIGFSAFEYCKNLECITFPDGLSDMGHDIIAQCKHLQHVTCGKITFSPAQVGDRNLDGILFLLCQKSLTIHILPDNIKYAMIWEMFAHNPEDTEILHYLMHFKHLRPAVLALKDKEPAFMQSILDDRRFVTEDNIDSLIEYAIEKQAYEIQVILMNYKYQHFGGEDSETYIKKKFEL